MLILKICKIYAKRKTDIVYDDLRKHFFTENEEFYCVHLLLAIIFFFIFNSFERLYSYGFMIIFFPKAYSESCKLSKMGRFAKITRVLDLGLLQHPRWSVSYYHKALHLGCSSSPRSASDHRF